MKLGLNLEHIRKLLALGFMGKVPVIPIRAVTSPDFLQHADEWDNAPGLPLTMLGNDAVGDCVIVMVLNFIRTVCFLNGVDYSPSTLDALALYSAITGYDPSQVDAQGNNPTDNGADPANALNYMVKYGFQGHKIAAFLAIDPHDIDHIKAAIQNLGGVMCAAALNSQAMNQFDAGQPWTILSLDDLNNSIGGHGILSPAFNPGDMIFDTWARRQPASWNWWWGCGVQAFAGITEDMLKNGKAPAGLDFEALQAYLQRVAN